MHIRQVKLLPKGWYYTYLEVNPVIWKRQCDHLCRGWISHDHYGQIKTNMVEGPYDKYRIGCKASYEIILWQQGCS